MNDPIEGIESNVRGYARLFPAVFDTASGSLLTDTGGRSYIDFFCGAGSLNYGHNPPAAKCALIEYIERDGIQHSLDTVTAAKAKFVQAFREIILQPRGLDYRIQFTGPTGTNAVEAAVKLAKKQTGRSHVVAFTRAYHGHTLGALALTANQYYHDAAYGSHNNVTHLPYDGYLGEVDTSELLSKMLSDSSSGLPKPAAIILETIQGEGGVNVASDRWLQRVASLCEQHDIRLIIDDIQVGNGRTGRFFSFEHLGIVPDMVCISKSLGGGLPLSIVLIAPQHDVWRPGEHTGTFRGNNLAFVAAAAVLENWRDPLFEAGIGQRSELVQQALADLVSRHPGHDLEVRGRGLIWGLDVKHGSLARKIIDQAFESGLLMEGAGSEDQVLKIMPALTISLELLRDGLAMFTAAVDKQLAQVASDPSSATPVNPVVAAAQVPLGIVFSSDTGVIPAASLLGE